MWNDAQEFKSRVVFWAEKIGVEPRTITVRPMTHKWASCSSENRLIFNSELLSMDRDLGDYVIVHELLHIIVPNHGKLWKSLMTAHLGDYQLVESRMKMTQPLVSID